MKACPSSNTDAVDQSSFWNSGSLNWDAHRVGWAVAGGCTVIVRFFRFPSTGVVANLAIDTSDIHYHNNFTLQVLGPLFKAESPLLDPT